MRLLRIALVLAALAAPLASHAAQRARSGTGLELGIGADYIVDPEVGSLMLTLAGDRALSSMVSAGIRVGALVTSSPSHVGAPIDVRLRIHGQRLYVEGLVGPWFIFGSDDVFRFHGAVGFGLRMSGMTLGLEAGVLDRSGIIGLRVAFAI